MSKYFILGGEDGHQTVPTDLMTWARMFELDSPSRVVAQTLIGDSCVSTVFLGLDHGHGGKLLLFETMVFGGDHDQYQDRYETWDQAEASHKAAVAMVEGVK